MLDPVVGSKGTSDVCKNEKNRDECGLRRLIWKVNSDQIPRTRHTNVTSFAAFSEDTFRRGNSRLRWFASLQRFNEMVVVGETSRLHSSTTSKNSFPLAHSCNGLLSTTTFCVQNFCKCCLDPAFFGSTAVPKAANFRSVGGDVYAAPSVIGCDIPDHGNSRVFAKVSGLSFRQ